jgi:hypothetical protein
LTSAYPVAAPQGVSAPTAQPGALPAGPTGPQINVAEIKRRVNQDVGVDIETTITGWQRSLIEWKRICAARGSVIQS